MKDTRGSLAVRCHKVADGIAGPARFVGEPREAAIAVEAKRGATHAEVLEPFARVSVAQLLERHPSGLERVADGFVVGHGFWGGSTGKESRRSAL